MKINRLELKDYKFLLLNNIGYIEITPINKLQLILGTNGSGKSSLLKELSPLPANHQEFLREGYKVIDITHLGSHYLLKSLFSSTGNKFHFIKDDEELNTGGTVTVYKELVKKEFGITPETHEIILGLQGFHSMSALERRNWFTRISDSDYTYALQYYQRLRDQLRDIQGSVKLSQARLVQESEKTLSVEDEATLRLEMQDIRLTMEEFLNAKQSIEVGDIRSIDQRIQSLTETIRRSNNTFLQLHALGSIKDIDDAMVQQQTNIRVHGSETETITTYIEDSRKQLETIGKLSVNDVNSLDVQIASIESKIKSKSGEIVHDITYIQPSQMLVALMSVHDNLVDILLNLKPNPERSINKSLFETLSAKHQTAVQDEGRIDRELNILIKQKEELEHYRDHNGIECPKCNHKWFQGYDERKYQTVVAGIETSVIKLKNAGVEIATLSAELEETRLYMQYQRGYVDMTRNWNILAPVWTYIMSTGTLFENPRSVISMLDTIRSDIQCSIVIESLEKELSSHRTFKDMREKGLITDVNNLLSNIAKSEERLSKLNTTISSSKEMLQQLKTHKEMAHLVEKAGNDLSTLLRTRQTVVKNAIAQQWQQGVNEMISLLKFELSKREQVLSKIDLQKSIIENLQSQIEEHISKAELLKIAINELSPSNGLIAKNLIGFINHFIHQVNNSVSNIWSYPLELLPVSLPDDGVDLDYKFPVRVNDSYEISDIAKGSSAMREIMDLCFRIVSMQYLGMEEYPIFLDEPGRTMDHSHRNELFKVISGLLTNSNHSNVFMISHYESSYACLKNTDLTVLCSSNIVIPKDAVVNKNTIIR